MKLLHTNVIGKRLRMYLYSPGLLLGLNIDEPDVCSHKPDINSVVPYIATTSGKMAKDQLDFPSGNCYP